MPVDGRSLEAKLANGPIEILRGGCRGCGWQHGEPGQTARVAFHRVSQLIVDVTRHSRRLSSGELLDSGRIQRQDLHIDAGGVHLRDTAVAEIAEPVNNVGKA
jgi:hypothetical protein